MNKVVGVFSLVVCLVFDGAIFGMTTVALARWNKPCSSDIQVYFMLLMIDVIVGLTVVPMYVWEIVAPASSRVLSRGLRSATPPPQEHAAAHKGHAVYTGYAMLLALFGLAVAILGSVLVFTTDTTRCDATLWTLGLVSLIMQYIVIANIVAAICVSCCMGCALVIGAQRMVDV